MLNEELPTQAARRFTDDLHILDDGEQELPIRVEIIARAPAAKLIASRAASRMWRRRTRSSGRIQHGCAVEHVLPEVAAQVSRGTEVGLATHELAELQLHLYKGEKADPRVRLELHQEIHIAIRTKVIAERRTEQPQLTNRVAAAESSDLVAWDIDACLAHLSVAVFEAEIVVHTLVPM